jgi:uncharacterized membrane protein YfhO
VSFKKILPYLLAFFVPVILMFVILSIVFGGLYPFGENTALILDARDQYVPFFKHLKSIVFGDNDFFYNFGSSVGGNFIGITAYYLLSPFNLIYLFFSDTQLPTAFLIATFLKIGLAGLTMFVFLKTKASEAPYKTLVFSVSYALMFYAVAFYYNTMWLDGVILLPLLALGIDRILLYGKLKLYTLALVLALSGNYYIGWMLCIFSALYFTYRYLLMYKTKREIKNHLRCFGRFMSASLTAVGLTAIILLPAYIALQNTYRVVRDADLDSQIWMDDYSFFDKSLPFFGGFTKSVTDNSASYNTPHIFVGLMIPVLLALLFATKKLTGREKLISGAFLTVLAIGFFVPAVDYVWHGFSHTNGFYYRYAFIFVFAAVFFAHRIFGRLKIPLGITVVLLAVQISSVVFYNIRNLWIIVRENPVIVTTPQNEFALNTATLGDIVKQNDSENDGLYRTEVDMSYLQGNDALLFGYNGISAHHSNIEVPIAEFMKKNRLYKGQINVEYSEDTPMSVDSLFGVKYVLQINDTSDGLDVAENDFALPVGFMTENGIEKQDISGLDVFDMQNKIFRSLSGIDTPVLTKTDIIPTLKNISSKQQGQSMVYSLADRRAPGYILFELPPARDNRLYIYLPDADMVYNAENYNDVPKMFIDGRFMSPVDVNRPISLNRKYADSDGYKQLAVRVDNTLNTQNMYIWQESKEAIGKHYAALADEPCELNKITSSHLTCTVTAKKDGNLFFSIPNDKGWAVKVDGKKVKTETAFELFMTFPLTAGTHNIDMKYTPAGVRAGVIVSTATVAALILVALMRFRKNTAALKASALAAGKLPKPKRKH